MAYPPTVNHYYTVARGRKILSGTGRAWLASESLGVRIQRANRAFDSISPLTVAIVIHPPDNRRRDLDNTLKPVLDALVQGRAIADDSLIEELSIRRGSVQRGGSVEVEINAVSKEEAHE